MRKSKLYVTASQFSRSRGSILNGKQFFRQLTKLARDKKKFGKNFSQIFNLHYWLMTKNKSVWRTPTSEMKIIKSSLFITKEKSTSKCQNLNEPSIITFPRERLFPRRMKAIFRYRSNKVSEFPRVYRPRTSQDSHIDGGRMNRDSGRSWIPRADRKLRSAVPSRLVKHFYDERLEVPVGWAIHDRWSVKIVRSIMTWRGRNRKKKQRRKRRIIPRARRPQRARTRISLRPAVLREFCACPALLSFRFPACARAVTRSTVSRKLPEG